MADVFSPEKRSAVMSKIKGKDTVIEILVRKYLFANGFRFRKNVATMPGKPDIVLKKYKTVVFVHGCFWHGHENCKQFRLPKTRTEFWEKKISQNIERDKRTKEILEKENWNVLILWECELEKNFESTMETLIETIKMH